MARNASPKEKNDALHKLGKLLECAGTARPWEEVARDLGRISTTTLNAIIYRVERARAQAFEEGQQHAGDADGGAGAGTMGLGSG